MIASEISSPIDAYESRLQRDGRFRLAWALQALVSDAICPRAECLLTPEEHDWLMDALSRPISEGTDAALSALLSGLAEMVKNAPPSLMARLETLRAQSDFSSD